MGLYDGAHRAGGGLRNAKPVEWALARIVGVGREWVGLIA